METYILLKVGGLGIEYSVLDKIRGIEGVKKAGNIFVGPWEIVMKVEVDSANMIVEIVSKMRRCDEVKDISPLMACV